MLSNGAKVIVNRLISRQTQRRPGRPSAGWKINSLRRKTGSRPSRREQLGNYGMNELKSIGAVTPPSATQIETQVAPAPSKNPLSQPDAAGTVAQPPPEADLAVKGWIEEINQAAGGRVGWVIQTGECFTKAKADLGRRRWGLLFGPGGVKFSQRRAEMFMAIVRCPVLTDPKTFSNLPGCWTVLHALSKVPVEVLTQAIGSGLVHPEMTLQEARELAKAHRVGATGPAPEQGDKDFDIDQRLNRLDSYLRREAARWPLEHRPELAAALREVATRLLEGRL
jgi:hypothetical protein